MPESTPPSPVYPPIEPYRSGRLPVDDLHTLYCNYNLISNLDGIGEQHADTLENFYCLPNPNLKDSVAMRFEREVGIRCKKA